MVLTCVLGDSKGQNVFGFTLYRVTMSLGIWPLDFSFPIGLLMIVLFYNNDNGDNSYKRAWGSLIFT